MSDLVQEKTGDGYSPVEKQNSEVTPAQAFVLEMDKSLNDIRHKFLHVGYLLTEANKNKYYKDLGYATLKDLAEDKWGFEKTTAYNLMDIYEFAHDPENPMQISSQYEKFSQSHLVEITRLKYRSPMVMEIIQISECSVRDLRKFVTLWNEKCDEGSGFRKGCKTVKDYLLKYDAEQDKLCDSLIKGIDKLLKPLETAKLKQKEEVFQTSGKFEVQNCPQIDEAVKTYASEASKSYFLDASSEQSGEAVSAVDEDYTQHSEPQKRPESEIIKVGLTGVDIYVEDAKFRIYDRYRNEPLKGNFAEFIKGVYNDDNKENFTHGFYSKDDNMNRTYDNNGVQFISFDPYQKIRLTWEEAAHQISDLIYTGDYLTSDAEQEQYFQWKAEKEGLKVTVIEPISRTEPEPPQESVIFQTSGKSEVKTQRARLSGLSTYELANEIVMKIVKIYPLKGESIKFVSAVRKGLVDWLDTPDEC